MSEHANRKWHVVLTGQLRSPEWLLASVREWAAIPSCGRMLVVTWDEEVAEARDLVAQLEAVGVEMVTAPTPPIRGIGHIWPQTLALKMGLDRLGEDEMVFKTRSDLRIDAGVLESIMTTPGYFDVSVAQRVFEKRIWVPWFERTAPFYLADECFAGRAGDLAKLNNFDESYSLLHPVRCGITHIRRFIHPFRQVTDAFEPALAELGDVGHFAEHRWDRLDALLGDDAYLRLLGSYYAALGSFFRIGCPDGAIEFREWSSGKPQPAIGEMAEAFSSSLATLQDGRHLMTHGEEWLSAALEGRLAGSVGDRFTALLPGVATGPLEIGLNTTEAAPLRAV